MQSSVKEDRHKYIGGSDIPVIMGISTFKTRFDLLLEKAQLKENGFDGNEYTEYGNIMESKIRNYINESLGKCFKEGQHVEGDIRLHTDGEDNVSILEIKTTSQIYKTVDEYKSYLVQTLFYMDKTNKNSGFIAVYERPEDFNEEFDKDRLQLFGINIDNYKELIERINDEVDKFRIDLEKVKANPLITEEELLPANLTEISEQLLAVEEQLLIYDELIKQQKELKTKLKDAMQKHNIKKWTTVNNIQITLVADTEDEEITAFNEKKFKEENEELYNSYLESKIRKGKSGYVKITLPKKED